MHCRPALDDSGSGVEDVRSLPALLKQRLQRVFHCERTTTIPQATQNRMMFYDSEEVAVPVNPEFSTSSMAPPPRLQ